jgi:hypothetical protein
VAHINGEDGTELPPGRNGEVYFEGGYDFDYLAVPAKTASARTTATGTPSVISNIWTKTDISI